MMRTFLLASGSLLFFIPHHARADCIHQVTEDAMAPVSLAPRGNFNIGGTENSFHACSGARISKIVVWTHPSEVRGIDITFSGYGKDGLWNDMHTSHLGHANGVKSEFTFKPNELVTEMTLYGNTEPKRPRLGGIHFKTSEGRSFNENIGRSGEGKYLVDVGSGFPMGWDGHFGDAIDQFAIRFFKIPQRQTVDITNYPNLLDVQPQLKSVSHVCKQISPVGKTTIGLSDSKKVTEGGKWSLNVGLKLGFEEKAKVGLPSIAEGEVTVKTEVSVNVGKDWTWSEDKTISSNESYTFDENDYDELINSKLLDHMKQVEYDDLGKPKLFVRASQEYYEAEMDTPFTGSVKMEFGNGISFDYPIHGTYSGVSYSDSRLAYEIIGKCPI
ncbi:MAG: hypothetical protein GY788_01950 [bacterium]|nr:hypothetical protein [bacterium]